MYRVSAAFAALSFLLLVSFMAQPSHAQESGRQEKAGIRGRVVVEPELLAATERPVDAIRAEALETDRKSVV